MRRSSTAPSRGPPGLPDGETRSIQPKLQPFRVARRLAYRNPTSDVRRTKILEAAAGIGQSDYERLRAQAVVLLLRHAALRISDIAVLQCSRIQKGELLLHTKKTGGAILLPLPDELLAGLEGLPVPRGADPAVASKRYAKWNQDVRIGSRPS